MVAGSSPPPPNWLDGASAKQRHQINQAIGACLLIMGAFALGMWLAPETPARCAKEREALHKLLQEQKMAYTTLQQSCAEGGKHARSGQHLKAEDKIRHEREGKRYAAALRKAQAQAAADLMLWFVRRWNNLLDNPEADDRTGRQAATLALLVGGMAANLNPGDYVPWQAELMDTPWLAELHFDANKDGYPAPRSAPNPHDGFTDVSICHVAMALNLTIADAQVLVTPEMRCDRSDATLSIFLTGSTLDDALTSFVHTSQEMGFLVKERLHQQRRLVLIGPKSHPKGTP